MYEFIGLMVGAFLLGMCSGLAVGIWRARIACDRCIALWGRINARY